MPIRFYGLSAVVLLNCGAPKPKSPVDPSTSVDSSPTANGVMGVEKDAGLGDAMAPLCDSSVSEVPTSAPLTFVLKNTAISSIFMDVSTGWGAVVYAYRGEPPNAQSISMFPYLVPCHFPSPHCPYKPGGGQQTQVGHGLERIKPGGVHEIIWNGTLFERGNPRTRRYRKKAQKCSEPLELPPGLYTLRACGFRSMASRVHECTTSTITLPLHSPTRVEMDFAANQP